MLNNLRRLTPTRFRSRPKYSLIVDESTDIGTCNHMAFVIKYFGEDDMKVHTKLLNLVEVKDTTALGLFNTVKQQLNDHKLNMLDIIGFSADTTNVMFGEHNSIVEKLRRESPDYIFVKYVCHSIALAVSKARAAFLGSSEALVLVFVDTGRRHNQ